MGYLGSFDIDDYIILKCNTHDPDTGDSADADAAPAYRIYEDDTGTPVTNNTLAVLDDANTVGFYYAKVQLLAATGFERGKCYTVHYSATVGGVTASKSDTFQIAAKVDAVRVGGVAPDDSTDIALAMRNEIVEPAGSITFGQAISFILAAVAGVTDDNGLTFKTPDGSTVRISATVVGSERTVITLTSPDFSSSSTSASASAS